MTQATVSVDLSELASQLGDGTYEERLTFRNVTDPTMGGGERVLSLVVTPYDGFVAVYKVQMKIDDLGNNNRNRDKRQGYLLTDRKYERAQALLTWNENGSRMFQAVDWDDVQFFVADDGRNFWEVSTAANRGEGTATYRFVTGKITENYKVTDTVFKDVARVLKGELESVSTNPALHRTVDIKARFSKKDTAAVVGRSIPNAMLALQQSLLQDNFRSMGAATLDLGVSATAEDWTDGTDTSPVPVDEEYQEATSVEASEGNVSEPADAEPVTVTTGEGDTVATADLGASTPYALVYRLNMNGTDVGQRQSTRIRYNGYLVTNAELNAFRVVLSWKDNGRKLFLEQSWPSEGLLVVEVNDGRSDNQVISTAEESEAGMLVRELIGKIKSSYRVGDSLTADVAKALKGRQVETDAATGVFQDYKLNCRLDAKLTRSVNDGASTTLEDAIQVVQGKLRSKRYVPVQ